MSKIHELEPIEILKAWEIAKEEMELKAYRKHLANNARNWPNITKFKYNFEKDLLEG